MIQVLLGDALHNLKGLPGNTVQTCVTSPPYFGLRDYGHEGQFGLESTPELFVDKLVEILREVKRVLREDGTLWLNLGDSYAGSWGNQGRKEERGTQREIKTGQMQNFKGYGDLQKRTHTGSWVNDHPVLKPKDLIGIPWRVAFALQADGWYLRQDIVWSKPNPMPESIRDRCTKSHEYIFLLSKSPRYYFDHIAIREPTVDNLKTRNKRSVWTVTTKPFKGAHFATFPEDLIEPCILACSKPGQVVLDPFSGSGTTGVVAKKLNRNYLGIELNPEYRDMSINRIEGKK